MGLQDELEQLLAREGPNVEWKLGGDPLKIVKKLAAFANGEAAGWVLCGVEESKDPGGFTLARPVGLDPKTFQDLKNRVPAWCRDKVHPPLIPDIEEGVIEGDATRRLLGFWISRSDHAHAVREAKGKEYYPINSDSHTIEARGELLTELLTRKSKLPVFLHRPCPEATISDIDVKALQEFVVEAGLPRSTAHYLEPNVAFDSFAPPLVVSRRRADRSSTSAPTHLALLLFGHEPTRFLPGAYVVLMIYDGASKTVNHSHRFEAAGTIPRLLRDVMARLQLYNGTSIDKSADALSLRQNRPRYSDQALQEALVNALAHRDYESSEPTRITIFTDRIAIANPGSISPSDNPIRVEAGESQPSWRNPGLARFLFRLGLAQHAGQGIPKILEETRRLSGAPPQFRIDRGSFEVEIPAGRAITPAALDDSPSKGREGLILISIGGASIDGAVGKCLPDLGLEDARVLVDFALPDYVEGLESWKLQARTLRNEVRRWIDNPEIDQLHLFYRGPVALAPLLGALVVPAKPLVVYHYENGRYSPALVLDRRFLRADDG